MADIPNLPTEISRDILSRLPVKSLLRFRCVSKPWCKLIDSKDFIKDHLKKSLTTHTNRGIILGGLDLYNVDLDALDVAHKIKTPFDCYNVSNSINGLFLVTTDDLLPLIWNPCTRKHRMLPVRNVELPSGFLRDTVCDTYGFGYDANNDDYKVVRSVRCQGIDSKWRNVKAEVFSLKSNSWREIDAFPYDLPLKRVWGVYVNGALHCHFVSPELIMAFHVGDEKHVEVPSPELPEAKSEISLLAELGGCLCLVNTREVYGIDVWIMKEYRVRGSWVKLFSVAPHLVPCTLICNPLVYSKSGNEVLLYYHGKLAWFDLKRKTLANVQASNTPFVFYALSYVGSLVRVDGDGGVDMKDGEDGFKKQKEQKKSITKKPGKKRDDFLSEGFKLVL